MKKSTRLVWPIGVPEIVGLPLEEARSVVEERGLELSLTGAPLAAAQYRIRRQDPAAGTPVDPGTPIAVELAVLVPALESKSIAGAGLDVFVSEPLPGDNPLLALGNLITSPHVAGVTLEASMRMAAGAAANVLAAFDGTLDPAAVVNSEVLSIAAQP